MTLTVAKLSRSLRWITSGALVAALSVWLIAVAFALAGFPRIAEGTGNVLIVLLPAVLLLLVLVAVAWLVGFIADWQARKE